MKYIVEYVAGCKGDLLTRFLNNSTENFSKHENNKTIPLDFGGPNWLKLLNPDDLTLDRFKDVLSRNKQNVISSHPIWQIPNNKEYQNILDDLGYSILKIKFLPKHYITIRIESLFKNLVPFDDSDPDYEVKRYIRKYFDKKEITNFDPTAHLESLLSENIFESRRKYNEEFLLPKNDASRTILAYDDIFINFNLSKYQIFDNLNSEKWKELVNQSWVPFTVKVGRKTYNLEEFGYRNFTIDS